VRANYAWDARRDRGIVTSPSLKTRLMSGSAAKSIDSVSLQRMGRQAKLSMSVTESDKQLSDRMADTNL